MGSSILAPSLGSSCGVEFDVPSSDSRTQYKRRRISSRRDLGEVEASLPLLTSPDYYTEPCLADLAAREFLDPGYCGRVPNFTVGKFGYGCVKFRGNTDVRKLEVDRIVKFNRHEIVVYGDESTKPAVGQGLNKPAEVTLKLKIRPFDSSKQHYNAIVKKLRLSLERQGGRFISFDPNNGSWSFLVQHFSRFGLTEDDEEDIAMDDVEEVHDPSKINDAEIMENGESREEIEPTGPMLYHSLPAYLGLDPIKMREMKMLMFPVEDEEEVEDLTDLSHPILSRSKEHMRRSLLNSSQRTSHRSSMPVVRKPPLALLEYNPAGNNSDSPGNILMAQQTKGLSLKPIRGEGFKLNLERQTPVSGSHSRNIVDAGLFMGKSFRVGWGPNGVLLHSGAPVRSNSSERWLSSVINVEKVGIDKVVRDENDKTRKELVVFAFDAPLNLHKSLNHNIKQVQVGSYALKLQKVITNKLALAEICRSYIDIIEGQLEDPGLSSSSRLVLMHQVLTWELIKVLFSERENSDPPKSLAADNEEDMMPDVKEGCPEIDPEAVSLIRRAEFSCWLQESVCHRVQEDVSALDESSYLRHIFLLLTGRQLDAAVEMAVSRGDVRLACLLSQAGGSTVNRDDIAYQLDLWRTNGLDFNFVEKERTRLYELLLSGNIHNALEGVKIDWKRFLGLLMWYRLPPDTPLPVIFQNYQLLLHEGKAPFPLPIYIDEGPVEEALGVMEKNIDLTYYLMLLHANGEGQFGYLKTMLSNFSSTYDPLDYHMIWHQRAVLEAAGVFTSNDLQVLDMGIVSQLLCTGQCHWAIYVVLHMPQCDDYPHFHATVIREILFQYCETWSSDESQHQFIQNLEIPSEWLHEAMAVYFSYYGNLSKALEHFLECAKWQKAHSIFTTSVVHTLFLSGDHSEVWRLATLMEEHKSQIEDWELGAGIYISFLMLKSSFEEDNNTMNEQDPLANKISDCDDFLSQLNESSAVLGDRLPTDARIAYSKMGEDVSEMLLSISSLGESRDSQLKCFDTVLKAPVPEDVCSNHLQDAVSLFTFYLSEMAAQSVQVLASGSTIGG